MKKLCILLAIITLLSCCLIGCSNSNQVTERTERLFTISDFESMARSRARQVIANKLLNPSSYQENSFIRCYSETDNKYHGFDIGYIYIAALVDYSAQNRMGGYERKTEIVFFGVLASKLEEPYSDNPYILSEISESSVPNRIKANCLEYFGL